MSETDDDDWFEKALREDDGDTETDATGASATDDAETDASGDGREPFDGSDPGGEPFGGESGGDTGDSDPFGGDAGGGGAEDDRFGGDADGETDGDPFGGAGGDTPELDAGSDPVGGGGGETDDDPFGGASDDTPDSDAGGESGPFGGVQGDSTPDAGGDGDAFGGGGSDPFGGVQNGGGPGEEASALGGGDEAGADPFGGARSGSGDGDDPFGEGFGEAMGGGAGSAETEFDEEEFESEIDRLDLGIEGLDDMILGGVPVRSLITVVGSAGTGKTTFGLQFLQKTMEEGGSGVYITLEETEEAIISTAEEKGWPFEEYVTDDRLTVVAMDPIEMANSLDSIRGDISRLVNDFGADRLVLDSVSLLEMMYDHPAKRRSEVFDFARSLKRAGVTTMLTSEANADNPYQSRHGLVEYLVDAVFVLQYVRPNDFQETRLAVEIQKIRDANHSRETKPYDITDEGISVYRQANIF